MSKTLIIALGTLLLGLGAGFAAGLWQATPDDSVIDAGSGAGGGDGGRANQNSERPIAEPRRQDAPSTKAPTAVAESAQNAAVAVETFVKNYAPPARPPGQGTIRGSVKTIDGTPVADVVVVFTPSGKSRSRKKDKRMDENGRPIVRSSAEVAKEALEVHLDRMAGRREVVTGGDGKFRIDELPDSGTGLIGFYKPGFIFGESIVGSDMPCQIGATIDVLARPSSEVEFDVVAAEGAPLDDAVVLIEYAAGGRTRTTNVTWTRAEPTIELAEGAFTVWAQPSDDDFSVSDKVRGAVPLDAATPQPIVLRLRPRLLIKGRVVFPDGQIQGDYDVALVLLAKGQAPLSNELFLKAEKKSVNRRQNAGIFRFDDLAPGTYQVAVTFGNAVVVGSITVEVVDRPVDVELKCDGFSAADYFVVRAIGPGNSPLADTRVTNPSERAFSTAPGVFYVARKGDPRRKYPGMPDGPDEKMTVTVLSQQYGSKSVDVVPQKDDEVMVKFAAPARLVVKIPGASTHPLASQFKVVLRLANAGPWDWGSLDDVSTTHKDDAWTIERLQPAAYRVALETGDKWAGGQTLISTDVNVVPGDNEVTLAIPSIGGLTVTFDPRVKANWVSLMGIGEGANRNFVPGTAKDGKWLFESVPGGVYELQAQGGTEIEAIVVSIPDTKELHVEYRPANALEVVSLGTKGTAAPQSGIEFGDVILGTPEEEWKKNPNQAIWGIIGSESDPVTLRVLRGGRVQDVSIDPAKLRDEFKALRMRAVVR